MFPFFWQLWASQQAQVHFFFTCWHAKDFKVEKYDDTCHLSKRPIWLVGSQWWNTVRMADIKQSIAIIDKACVGETLTLCLTCQSPLNRKRSINLWHYCPLGVQQCDEVNTCGSFWVGWWAVKHLLCFFNVVSWALALTPQPLNAFIIKTKV